MGTLLPLFVPGKRGDMENALVGEELLIPTRSTEQGYTQKTFKNGKKIVLTTLQIIGYAILATFGIWPGLAFLFYMAMTS